MNSRDTFNQMYEILDSDDQQAVLNFMKELSKKAKYKKSRKKGQETPLKPCPDCQSENVIKSGFSRGKQRFECKCCGRHYVTTTGTIMENSHFGEDIWKIAAEDMLAENVSLDKTAEKTGMSHRSAFNMRHKLLLALHAKKKQKPVVLSGISELDGTYVLECEKGKKFSEDSSRKPRKHGAVASKPGISDEYICIMAGVQRGGAVYANSLNRAHPSNEEIKKSFKGHIAPGSVAFTDGLKGYKCLEDEIDCVIESVPREEEKRNRTSNLNCVNGFHSHIQAAYRHYRGVATKYLNRYNALFETVYRKDMSIDEIVNMLLEALNGNEKFTNKTVQFYGLLNI